MDANIAKHINDEDPIFTYYWAPTSILGRLPMFLLTPEVPHDKAA
jgi:ABC-type proline/glycine betaine transport system substrate-binding protein